MSHPIQWRRLVGFLLLALAPLLLLYVVEQSAVALRYRYLFEKGLQTEQQMARRFLPDFRRQLARLRQEEGVNPSLVARMQAELNRDVLLANQASTLDYSYLEAVCEAVFFPIRTLSSGTITHPWGTTSAYTAPISLHRSLYYRELNLALGGLSYLRNVKRPFVLLLVQLSLILGIPLGFLLLPRSRRLASVRWVHLVRVAMYSGVIPIVILYVVIVLICIGLLVPRILPLSAPVAWFALQYASGVFLLLWWAMAIKHYLKMSQSWIITGFLSLLTITIVMTLIYTLTPGLMIHV